VDIGGSGVRAARVGADGIEGPRAVRRLDRTLSHEEIAEQLRAVVAELGPGDGVAGVGVAFPGFPDDDGRISLVANLPGLNGMPLEEELGPVTAAPVSAIPDLAAAALAEARIGAGLGSQRFLCTAIGTGVNAALTVDGQIRDVSAGCFGDAGHVIVEPDGPECFCGGRGCLEAVCSGLALARDGAPLGLDDGAAVIDAAREGDAGALAIVERAGVALGRAIASWTAIAFPDRVAVAGGVAAAGDLLLDPARAELQRVGVPYLVDELQIVLGALGAEATLAGAGLAALAAEEVRA
jgi:glucokinase